MKGQVPEISRAAKPRRPVGPALLIRGISKKESHFAVADSAPLASLTRLRPRMLVHQRVGTDEDFLARHAIFRLQYLGELHFQYDDSIAGPVEQPIIV